MTNHLGTMMKLIPTIAVIFAASHASARGDTPPPLRRVAVPIPTVVGETPPGSRASENEPGLREELQREALQWTMRALLVNKVAAEAAPMSGERGGAFELRSEFHIPLAIPANLAGRNAIARRGKFMSARFTLVDGSGQPMLTEDVSLVWGDGKWLVGTPRYGRRETAEATLKSFIRKASDRAVLRLKRDLLARKGGRSPARIVLAPRRYTARSDQ